MLSPFRTAIMQWSVEQNIISLYLQYWFVRPKIIHQRAGLDFCMIGLRHHDFVLFVGSSVPHPTTWNKSGSGNAQGNAGIDRADTSAGLKELLWTFPAFFSLTDKR